MIDARVLNQVQKGSLVHQSCIQSYLIQDNLIRGKLSIKMLQDITRVLQTTMTVSFCFEN